MPGESAGKVTPIGVGTEKLKLHPRLEELRQLLQDSEPIAAIDSDQRVIEDERAFRRRFGYGFSWPRRHREALIHLKHQKDLTDAEIKLFRHTGNLRRTAFGVQLNASGWIAAWGWVQISLFAVLFGVPIVIAGLNFAGSPAQALRIGLVSVGLIGFCFAIYLVYIQPWAIQSRVRESGDVP